MSLARRKQLVELARRHDALIICDDVYDFLQWPVLTNPPSSVSSTPIPAVKPPARLVDIDLALGRSQFDPEGQHFGHVLSNGTFSKLIGPGLRTGWVEAAPDLAYGLSQTGSTRSGGAPSQMVASFIAEMLKTDAVNRHVEEKVRPALQHRHALMVQTIKAELKGMEFRSEGSVGEGVSGGYFVWLTLPKDISGKEVADRAREEENLMVAEGEVFEVRGDERSPRFPHHLRLCFSWEEERDVVEGVRRLAGLLGRMRVQGTGKKEREVEGNAGNAAALGELA